MGRGIIGLVVVFLSTTYPETWARSASYESRMGFRIMSSGGYVVRVVSAQIPEVGCDEGW